MKNISLVKFEDNIEHYKLMYKWCNEKYIYEWFEQRKLSYDEIVNKYKGKLHDNKQKLFMISYDNELIGL